MENWVNNSNGTLKGYIEDYFQPMVVLVVNFFIVPFLIDTSCEFEDFRRKSSR
jgi:hypothetical protein